MVLAVVASAVLNAMKVSNGNDETIPFDYFADADDPRVQKDLADHRPGRTPTPTTFRATRRPADGSGTEPSATVRQTSRGGSVGPLSVPGVHWFGERIHHI